LSDLTQVMEGDALSLRSRGDPSPSVEEDQTDRQTDRRETSWALHHWSILSVSRPIQFYLQCRTLCQRKYIL